jgi:hypothetical protein
VWADGCEEQFENKAFGWTGRGCSPAWLRGTGGA